MKKPVLACLAIAFGLGAMAQNASWVPPKVDKAKLSQMRTAPVKSYLGNEVPKLDQRYKARPANMPTGSRAVSETTIGTSKYDLQTNASIQRRILNHGNGDITAIWTFATDNQWATRGTGYAFYDGSSWTAAPTAPIETERTGWPNVYTTNSGGEVLIAHNTLNDVARRSDRNSIGSGTWNQANLSNLDIQVWTRTAAVGNTVHLIGLTLPVALDGTVYNGIDGALLYNRSDDGGQTWTIQNVQLPFMTNAEYTGIGGDAYSIDARGNEVAIVVGDIGYGVGLWRSSDNGVNWTRTWVLEPEFPLFDEAIHFIAGDIDSAMMSSDGGVSVILDNNDKAHVFYSEMPITNDDLTDGNLGFFPFWNAIKYWNEDMGAADPVTVAGALDINGNGQIDIPDNTWLASYRFNGMAGFPSAGIDANGDIYMTYSAVDESLDNTTQNYRHVYGTMTADNGCTWTTPIDLTSGSVHDFDECAFPSLARLVDTKGHLIYQKDFEPGYAVAGDEDPVTDNDMVYLNFDVTDVSGQPVGFCQSEIIASGTEFCPGDSIELSTYCGSGHVWTVGGQTFNTPSVWVSTYGQVTLSLTTPCGTLLDTIDLVAPTGGPSFNLSASSPEICPGDQSILSATQIGAASYLWSTGATSHTTTVTNVGTYTVSVTDCGGTSVQSITITTPGAPTPTITGTSTICPGDSVQLSVNPVPGGSYLWSNGDTTSNTWVYSAGTYNVQVSNCGGSGTDAFGISPEAAPQAVINPSGSTTFCEGEDVTLAAAGGSSYQWTGPSGAVVGTTATLLVNSNPGTYTLTSYNLCGDSATNTSTITINPKPATPVITYNGGNTFTSSSATGNQWYVNGILVPNATSQTFTPDITTVDGQSVTVVVTDGNGCESDPSSPIVGLDNPQDLFQASFSVYPNPNDGRFFIAFRDIANDTYNVEIRNIVGQLVHTESLNVSGELTKTLEMSHLNKGIYMLTISNDTYETTQKIILK